MAGTRQRSGGLIGRLRGAGRRPAREPAREEEPRTTAQEPATDEPRAAQPASDEQERVEPAHPTRDPGEPPPDSPTDIEPRGWVQTFKRTGKEFKDDNLTDWSAALTYYSVLSLFPLLIVLVALVGLLGQYPQTVTSMIDIIREIAPGSAADTIERSITGVVRDKGGAGALLGVGLLGAIWSASGYIGAFMRASNAVYDVEEGRPFWKLRPIQLAITLVMVVMLALLAIGFVASGSVARAIGDTIGLGDSAVTVWNIAKWPVMLLIAIVMVALLTWAGPNVKHPRFRWITPGSAVAMVALVVASVGFAFYAANFGSYNATYGALGGVIVFLIWLWIANLALLFGVELDAELERQRELESGQPEAARELQLEPREAPKD